MAQQSSLKIRSGRLLRGRIVLPASKSISGRALVINALSGSSLLPDNLSDSDDTQAMLNALHEMPEERMKHRPIGILVDALRTLGADIAYEGEEGFPPLRIAGRNDIEGGELSVPGNVSSQYISALLMIAPTLKKGLRLTLTGQIASRPYLDMTMSMMRDFGAEVEWIAKDVIEVKPGSYRQRPYHIESDWSAASYWYEMVALSPAASDADT